MGTQRVILAIALILASLGLSVNREEIGAVPLQVVNTEHALTCSIPNCPEVAVDYSPDYPALGDYSVAGACDAVHPGSHSGVVTLHNGEALSLAIDRLHLLSGGDKIEGVIEIPWDVDTVQCDSLRIMKKDIQLGHLTIRGIPGPAGEQPRFYCRSAQEKFALGGTIPSESVTPYFFRMALDTDTHQVMFENLHIDGYGGALKLGNTGHYIVRNSYMHHGPDNGIASANIEHSDDAEGSVATRFSLEVCGVEISHYGQGNSKHNFYVHRALGGGGENPQWMAYGAADTWSQVTLVDSLIHSPGWGSAFKSIANKNVIIGNRFFSQLTTDANFPVDERFSAQMLIDVPSCSTNIIRNNELHSVKDTKLAGGEVLLGLRNRRTAMRGCDIPTGWSSQLLGGTQYPTKINGPVHSFDWWQKLDEAVFFSTIIEDNVFSVKGTYSHMQTAVQLAGTYPVYEGLMKQSCLLPAPDSWYERSRAYVDSNTYRGFNDFAKVFELSPGTHSFLCQDQPRPAGPGPVDELEKLIEMGPGETYYYGKSTPLLEQFNHDPS